MLRLAAEKGLRYEQREICVLMSCSLEHPVKLSLYLLPDSIAVRLDDHTSPHCGILRQISLYHKIVIPLGVILLLACNFFCH